MSATDDRDLIDAALTRKASRRRVRAGWAWLAGGDGFVLRMVPSEASFLNGLGMWVAGMAVVSGYTDAKLGISKPVTLKVANFKCGEQPFNKKPMCAAQATTTIKRSEWGMTEGIKMTNPGDDIQLIIPVEAYRDMS